MTPHALTTLLEVRKFSGSYRLHRRGFGGRLLCHAGAVAYLGNLTCNDCGLTFTARWGSFERADEYRCANDHVVHVEPQSQTVLAIDGSLGQGRTLVELRGLCPVCESELATGLLPSCPVCGGRDHNVLLSGTFG